MLGGHKNKPLLLCSYTIGPFFGRIGLSLDSWGTSIGSPSHKCRNPGDHLSVTQVLSIWRVLSKFCGLTLNLTPALCHSWWFHSGSVSAGWGTVPSTTLLDLKKKKIKQARSSLYVYVVNGVTSSDTEEDFYVQLFLQGGVSLELENQLWLSWLSLISSSLPFLVISSQLPLLCPKVISSRKRNIAKWSKKSYRLPYQSQMSWVTLRRTWARWYQSALSCDADTVAASQT